jgi:hypothetical protein
MLTIQDPALLYNTRFNSQKICVLPTQSIYVFCMNLRTNRDYFPIKHWLTSFCNRDGVCLLRGTSWNFVIQFTLCLEFFNSVTKLQELAYSYTEGPHFETRLWRVIFLPRVFSDVLTRRRRQSNSLFLSTFFRNTDSLFYLTSIVGYFLSAHFINHGWLSGRPHAPLISDGKWRTIRQIV